MLAAHKAIEFIGEAMKFSPMKDKELIKKLIDNDLLVLTDDGSYTLRSSSSEELMHSRIGAIKEAFEKFVEPSDITHMDSPRVLDLCCGMGYNAMAALEKNPNTQLLMIDMSEEMLYLGKILEMPFQSKNLLNKAINDYFNNQKNDQIKIICGDARKTLQRIQNEKFDVIFHDGFSPGKAPVLYTVEFLNLLKGLLDKKGILVSYSSSIPFRSSLLNAGFYIAEGPSVGRKRGITIASPHLEPLKNKNKLPFHDELLLTLTTTKVPFRDPQLNLEAHEIFKNRELERQKLKETGKTISTKKVKKNQIDDFYKEIYERYADSKRSIEAMDKFLLTKEKI